MSSPPIKGHELAKVVAIRTIEDAAKVKAMIPNIRTAAVIGGGVLGLEAAWSLKRAKLDVTVIEGAPTLMSRQLNPAASDTLKKIIEAAGVRVFTAASTAEINEDGVLLADGTAIPAELVIVSTGVRGNLDIAKAAGIEINRSILVKPISRVSMLPVTARSSTESITHCGASP